MPNDFALKKEIMEEAHRTPYLVHPCSTKMYHDIWETYWWNNMKKLNLWSNAWLVNKLRQYT